MRCKLVFHDEANSSVLLDDVEICRVSRHAETLWHLYAVKDGVELAPCIGKDTYQRDILERLGYGVFREEISELVGVEFPPEGVKPDFKTRFIGKDCQLKIADSCLFINGLAAIVEVPMADYVVAIEGDKLVTIDQGIKSVTPLSEVQFTLA